MNKLDRFWRKVDKTGKCWIWTGAASRNGYGKLRLSKRYYLAHRLSYQIKNGEVSKGLLVCHTCDIRLCVNPDHLFLGTHQDNAQDKVNKNRQLKGRQIRQAILTEDQVLSIRKRYICGEKIPDISRELELTYHNVYNVITGRTWVWLQ